MTPWQETAALRDFDPADVRSGSWLCENSSGRATRRNISEQLHLWESNHTAQATFDALPENCVFYISRMYEFLHRLGQQRRRRLARGSGACPILLRFPT